MDHQIKNKGYQIVRNVIQAAAFFFMPGLFISSLAGIKSLVQGIATMNMSGVLAACFQAILLLVLTALFGRFFCGFLCSFGTMGDVMHFVGAKLLRIRWQMPVKIDKFLKLLKYIIFPVLVVIWLVGKDVPSALDPWNAFGSLMSLPPAVSYVFENVLVGALLLIVIMVASLFVERFFCRYLCPMGAVFAVVSHLRIFKLFKPRENCGSCSLCSHTCKMGIRMEGSDRVTSGECIDCMQCVASCPKKNLRPQIFREDVAMWVVSLIAVVTMGMYVFGNPAVSKWSTSQFLNSTTQNPEGGSQDTQQSQNSSDSSEDSVAEENGYQDGTFEGSGTGFRGGTTTISVTIQNGEITDIQTVSTQDDEEWYNEAFSSIRQSVLDSQNAEVDAVTGATYSSNGIREAISNALAAAKGESVDSSVDSNSSSDSSSDSDSLLQEDGSNGEQSAPQHEGGGEGHEHHRNRLYYQ